MCVRVRGLLAVSIHHMKAYGSVGNKPYPCPVRARLGCVGLRVAGAAMLASSSVRLNSHHSELCPRLDACRYSDPSTPIKIKARMRVPLRECAGGGCGLS